MEPVSIATILAGMAGAASTKFIGDTWDYGKKWLADYFKNHGQQVKDSAEKNVLDFINDLAKRVNYIETNLQSTTEKESVVNKLQDPDFAATLQSAMIVSARTSSVYKHEILSRTVAERLLAPSEGLIELSTSMAINAIQHLGEKHLNILGAITVIAHIRPDENDVPTDHRTDQFPNFYTNWLKTHLSWIPSDLDILYLDYLHLVSVSCLDYAQIGTRDINLILTPPVSYQSTHPWSAPNFLQEGVGKRILKWWNEGMDKAHLTTTGMLIGTYVVDNKTGSKTRIDW